MLTCKTYVESDDPKSDHSESESIQTNPEPNDLPKPKPITVVPKRTAVTESLKELSNTQKQDGEDHVPVLKRKQVTGEKELETKKKKRLKETEKPIGRDLGLDQEEDKKRKRVITIDSDDSQDEKSNENRKKMKRMDLQKKKTKIESQEEIEDYRYEGYRDDEDILEFNSVGYSSTFQVNEEGFYEEVYFVDETALPVNKSLSKQKEKKKDNFESRELETHLEETNQIIEPSKHSLKNNKDVVIETNVSPTITLLIDNRERTRAPMGMLFLMDPL